MTFGHELRTKEIVSLHIGSVFELVPRLESGLLDSHRSRRTFVLFQVEEIANPRRQLSVEYVPFEGGPKIYRATEGLLGSIVEIVAKKND